MAADKGPDVHATRSEIIRGILQTHVALQKDLDTHNQEHDSKMKAYYDQRRNTPCLKIGNIIFVKETVPPNKSKKFASHFEGPYIITELQEHQRVRLRNLHTNKEYSHPLHMSRLKLAKRYQIDRAYKNKDKNN